MRFKCSPSRTPNWHAWKTFCLKSPRWPLWRLFASTASRSTARSTIAPRTACTRISRKPLQRCANCRHCLRSRTRITDRSSACAARTGNNAWWTSQINVLEYKPIPIPKPAGAPRLIMAMRALCIVSSALFIGACAQAPMKPSSGHVQTDSPLPSGTIPAPVQISTLLPRPRPAIRPETYSVVVNNVSVQELLFALARDAKLNVDISPGIRGVVTLNAIDQSLQQLLSRLAKQVDMRWELDGPNLAVMPDTPFLRVYKVDYLNIERSTTGTVGDSSQISSGAATGGAGGGGGSGGGASGNTSSTTVQN